MTTIAFVFTLWAAATARQCNAFVFIAAAIVVVVPEMVPEQVIDSTGDLRPGPKRV